MQVMVVSLLAAPRTAAATGGRSRPQWGRSPPAVGRAEDGSAPAAGPSLFGRGPPPPRATRDQKAQEVRRSPSLAPQARTLEPPELSASPVSPAMGKLNLTMRCNGHISRV